LRMRRVAHESATETKKRKTRIAIGEWYQPLLTAKTISRGQHNQHKDRLLSSKPRAEQKHSGQKWKQTWLKCEYWYFSPPLELFAYAAKNAENVDNI